MAGLIAVALATLAMAQAPEGLRVGAGPRTVSGRVIAPSGTRPAGLSVLVHRRTSDTSWMTSFAAVSPDGRFTASGLEPGSYILEARPNAGSDAVTPGAQRGFAAVRVGRQDLAGVAITLERPTTVRGRLRLDGGVSPSSPPKTVRVLAQLTLGGWTPVSESAMVAQDGTFMLAVVGPQIVRVGWEGPDDGTQWWFESAWWKDRDVTNEPVNFADEPAGELVLVFALRPTAIVGSLEDVAGIPMASACVVMLPDDPDLQRSWSTAVGTATTDRRGRFHFTGMPPGEYHLLGLAHACPDSASLLSDAEVFMRRATPVTVVAQQVARLVVTGETSGRTP